MNLQIFEKSKKNNEFDQPYRTAREMSKILEYVDYRSFSNVIKKAKEACKNSGQLVGDHFVEMNDMVPIGSGAVRKVANVKLSRYACYLIVQNADPSKEIVAQGQTYFATQTRKQEIIEHNDQYLEDQRRLEARKELSKHNKKLFSVAKKAGVKNYAQFQDAGYMGLYGEIKRKQLAEKKGIDIEENILDYMSSEELGGNLFRATQTEAKLRRDIEQGENSDQQQANQTHYEVGKKVRQTIQELGGTMPEELPAVEHISEVEKRLKSLSYDLQIPLHAEKTEHTFLLPTTIDPLKQLVELIKTYPGDEVVRIGDAYYKLSSEGVALLHTFLGSYLPKDY